MNIILQSLRISGFGIGNFDVEVWRPIIDQYVMSSFVIAITWIISCGMCGVYNERVLQKRVLLYRQVLVGASITLGVISTLVFCFHLRVHRPYLLIALFFGSIIMIAVRSFWMRYIRMLRSKSVEISEIEFSAAHRALKRIYDIIFSAAILLISSPILLLCAIAVKLNSSGPVIFRQKRVGQNEKMFTIFKFRTMIVDIERRDSELLQTNEDDTHILYKVNQDDPRITRVGKFLRKTSLDEFPQFFNVLAGSMSVVGPRPQVYSEYSEYKEYSEEYAKRLNVKPGVTGMWQISGRNKLTYEQSKALDIEYVEDWNLLDDFVICILTIKEVFLPSGI